MPTCLDLTELSDLELVEISWAAAGAFGEFHCGEGGPDVEVMRALVEELGERLSPQASLAAVMRRAKLLGLSEEKISAQLDAMTKRVRKRTSQELEAEHRVLTEKERRSG